MLVGVLINNKNPREAYASLGFFYSTRYKGGTMVAPPRYKGGTSSLQYLYDFSSAFLIVLHTRLVR